MTETTDNLVQAMPKGTSLWEDAFHRLRKNRLAMFGLCYLLFLIVLCLLTPLIAPYGYEEQNLRLGAVPPNAEHWLGTDTFVATCSLAFFTVAAFRCWWGLSPRSWPC